MALAGSLTCRRPSFGGRLGHYSRFGPDSVATRYWINTRDHALGLSKIAFQPLQPRVMMGVRYLIRRCPIAPAVSPGAVQRLAREGLPTGTYAAVIS